MEEIYERDRYGRMKYNPEFHPNHGKPFSTEELQYVVDWYDIIGSEELSFAIGKTEATIQNKVVTLRKRGIMPPITHKRGQNKHYRTLGVRDGFTNANSFI